MNKIMTRAILIAGIWSLVSTSAYAYIDSNAGTILFQIMAPIVALVTTGWLLAKENFKRAIGWVTDSCRRLLAKRRA